MPEMHDRLCSSVDKPASCTLLSVMLDPAIIHNLHQAMAIPTIMPPAIERAWLSPLAEQGEKVVGPWLADAEERAEQWRTVLRGLKDGLDQVRSMDWFEENLADLDLTIRQGHKIADQVEAWTENQRRAGMKINKFLARNDLSAAAVQRKHVDRFVTMNRENVRTLRQCLVDVREYRNFVDTRIGAEPGVEPKPWIPNTATMTAIRDARSKTGVRRASSVAELLAALHEEGD